MNEYELAVLYHPDLDVDLSQAEDKLKKIITDNGGEVTAIDNWGKRKLAYNIKGNEPSGCHEDRKHPQHH
jgi:small subunit ribosomal protein S6